MNIIRLHDGRSAEGYKDTYYMVNHGTGDRGNADGFGLAELTLGELLEHLRRVLEEKGLLPKKQEPPKNPHTQSDP